jgi:glutamyl endopeptidase
VVRIEGQFTPNAFFFCTGWMLGPSTVVTAGHCVYDYRTAKTYAYNVKITPAYNSAAQNTTPFGSCVFLQGFVMQTWINTGDIGYDYGIYRLGCRIGEQTGNFGFKVTPGDWVGNSVALAGYPADKGGTTMWASLGSIIFSNANSFYYDNDMMSGQSGGPVWDNIDPNCYLCVVAINANEFAPPDMNQGAQINNTVFNFLLYSQQFVASQIFLPMIQNQ